MDRGLRRKLAMAASVRTFSRAHPSADGSYTLVLDRLDGTIIRMEELAKQQQGGFASKHSSAVRRQDLRRRMQTGLLRHLITVAEDAGTAVPAVAEKFRLPGFNSTHTAFRAGASKMLDEGRAQAELLAKHGLSETALAELEAAIKEFDASLQESDDGKQSHVAARAEMKTLGDEIMRLVGMLDGFNRYRFHQDPALIVAWESAKHLVGEPEAKVEDPTTPVAAGLEPAA